jgi:hypothetical protein
MSRLGLMIAVMLTSACTLLEWVRPSASIDPALEDCPNAVGRNVVGQCVGPENDYLEERCCIAEEPEPTCPERVRWAVRNVQTGRGKRGIYTCSDARAEEWVNGDCCLKTIGRPPD